MTGRTPSRWPLLALALLLAAALRTVGFEEVFLADGTVAFAFGDAFYHARRALWSFENFPRVLFFDACLNHPDGSVVPHPPLLDWSVAAVARAFGSSREVFERVAAASPVVLGALTVLPVYALGAALGRAGAGLGAAFLYAALPIPVSYARIGNADHHAAAGLLGALFLAGVVASLDPARRSAALAALQAGLLAVRLALLGTWAGSLLILGPGELALALAGAVAGRTDLLRAHAAATLATAALMAPLVAVAPTPNGGPFSTTELSWLHVALYAAAGLVSGAAAWAEAWRPARSATVRALRLGGLAAGAGLGLLLLPGVLESAGRAAGFLARDDAYTGLVVEQLPLFWEQGALRAAAGERRLGYYAYALPLVPLVWLLLPAPPAFAARRALLFAWSVLFGLLALQQFRYVHDFAPAACVAFAAALGEGARALAARGVPRRAASLAAVLAGVALWAPTWPRYWAPNVETTLAHLRGAYAGVDRALLSLGGSQLRFAQALAAATPPTPGCDATLERPAYGVLAHPAIGHVLHYSARRATPADPFGPYIGSENLARVMAFLRAEDEAEALALAVALDTPFVVTAEEGGDAAPASMAHRLHRQDGSASAQRPHLGHFRLLLEGPRGGVPLSVAFEEGLRPTAPYKLFERVRGALLVVAAEPGEAVEARLPVLASSGRRFVFRARARAGADGAARLRVPYATEAPAATGARRTRSVGDWRVHAGGAVRLVAVSERAVAEGLEVRVEAPPGFPRPTGAEPSAAAEPAMDPPQVAGHAEHVAGSDARARHVAPDLERELAYQVPHGLVARHVTGSHPAGQQLHVEHPAREEGLGERLRQGRRGAEELRAALGVVDGDPQHVGDPRGGHAAEVVAQHLPLDAAPEQLDPRAQHHLQLRVRLEGLQEALQGCERRGAVRVPEADPLGVLLQRAQQTAPHRLALAAVLVQGQHREGRGGPRGQPLEQRPGSVAAAVVHEPDAQPGALGGEGEQGLRVEARRLVVARHHQGGGGPGAGHGRAHAALPSAAATQASQSRWCAALGCPSSGRRRDSGMGRAQSTASRRWRRRNRR